MIRHFTLIAASILILCGPAAAEPIPEMDACNQLYHDASYELAITCYETIGTSSELLFNIGNSYAEMGQHGYAVLSYLRALCLSPNDTDIHNNLAQIRKENSLFPPEPSFTDRVFSALTLTQWSYFCLALLILYLVFLLATLFKKRRRITTGMVTLVCLLLIALGSAGTWHQYNQWQKSVVVEDDRLLVSPFDKSESVGTIAQGRLITLHKTYREYVYITDETGRTGWLHNKSQRSILPAGKKLQ